MISSPKGPFEELTNSLRMYKSARNEMNVCRHTYKAEHGSTVHIYLGPSIQPLFGLNSSFGYVCARAYNIMRFLTE